MKERPILFSGDMVRAILDGRKTQTRRVVKARQLELLQAAVDSGECAPLDAPWPGHEQDWSYIASFCPYGQPGDRLWLRESFALEHSVEHDDNPPHNDGRPVKLRANPKDSRWVQAHYRATDNAPELAYEYGFDRCASCRDGDPHVHWKTPIHMPRWASRITLEVTAVRVERLQDISEEDARAEGVAKHHGIEMSDGSPCYSLPFWNLWKSIHGIDNPSSWDANPWVWVIEFRRIGAGEG